jgi:autotransporter-associated beta strand protein
MLASAGIAQAQQNVTQATWLGAGGDGGTGIWDKWNTAPTAHNYWRATNLTPQVAVSGVRLTNAANLLFTYTGPALAAGATNDILIDSNIISSQSQTLRFQSSGYRLLPGAFSSGIQPTTSNFQDIDLARTLVNAPYTSAPNGTLQIGDVTFTVAGIAGPVAAQPFLTLRNPTSFGGAITAVNANTTINLESFVASTISGTFRGNGNIAKTGGAVLQYQGYTSRMFDYNADTRPYSYVQTIFGPALSFSRTNATRYGNRPRDLAPTLAVNDGGNNDRLNGLQGQMRVDGGLLMVSGHLNMWHDFGTTVDGNILTVGAQNEIPLLTANIAAGVIDTATLRYNLAKRMTGVSSVVLNGSAEISFTNTPVNVGTGATALRLNFLHNLRAGDNNDQFQTTVTTGPDDNYRLGIHIDQGFDGSVGILAGSGKVIKTGAGSLTVLNDSRMTGDFIAAGGRTILASSTGLTFANSSSFNIAGTQDEGDSNAATTTEGALGLSRRGADIRYQETPSNSGNDPRVDYRPALFPDTGTLTITTNGAGQFTGVTRTGAEVVLVGDQTVRNFQADFALKSKGSTNVGSAGTGEVFTAADAVRTAADVNNKGELVVVGTGAGSNLYLNGNTLTINQDATGRDGYYNGSVYGADLDTGVAGGRIIKTGGGTLVFLLQNGAYDYTEIQGGTFIANVQGLGQKDVFIGNNGTFAILQNNAGTLAANLSGSAGSTLKLLASAMIDNGSGSKIEVNPGRDPGQVNIINGQANFLGNIVVNDGVNLSFSGGANNTFINASSIKLDSGNTRETVLKFGDTNQLIRNLSGDLLSRVELGRGDITLEQNSASASFLGSITGVGSLIKQGSASFTLAGTTSGGAVKDAYFGATIVRPGGALIAGTANATPNTSALVLVGAGTFNTGGLNQTFGGLFGSAASTLNIGAATVTVGYTPARAALMATELGGTNPLLADYLGTTDQVNPLLNIFELVPTGVFTPTSLTTDSATGLQAGQTLTGAGLEPGTLITGVVADTTFIATGGAAGASTITTAATAGLVVGQTVSGTGIPAGATILAITPTDITISAPLTETAAGTVTVGAMVNLSKAITAVPSSALIVAPTTTFTPTTGDINATELTATSSNGLGVGQTIVGTGIADGSYITNIVANTTFTISGGIAGTANLRTVSSAGLAVGQTIAGTGIPAGAKIAAIIPNTTFFATGGAVGTRTITTTATTGLFVGQTLSGTGIPSGATITAVSPTAITISASLTAKASGTVNVGALIGLTNALTTTASGTATVGALISLNNPLTATLAAVPVNVGTVRSIDVSSLGLTAAELNALYAGSTQMTALTRRYLSTVAVGTNIGSYTAPTTDIAFTNALSFDGQLVGTGTFVKSGAETLFLRGVSAGFTGQVQINGGTLDISFIGDVNNLKNASAITVNVGGSLAVTVDDVYVAGPSAVTRTLNTPILGAGNFIKNGVGYLKLDPTLAAGQVPYSGTTIVNNGWLEMNALATNGAAVINSFNGNAAHLVLNATNDVTYSGLVSGSGELVIQAAAGKTLTAGGSLTHTGGTNVLTGTLLAQNGWAGATTGNISVAAGATARLNVATNLSATGVFVGAGTIVKEGAAALTLGTPTTAFSGTFQSNAGTTVLASANLFGGANPTDLIAAIDLRGNSILDVTADQTFRNLTGEATTQISYGVDFVNITLPIDAGATNSFAGRFTRGAGVATAAILKTGAGTLDLSPAGGNNELTLIGVESGRLVGTAAGYLGANILVGAGAEVAFNAPTAGVVSVFANNIEGFVAGTGTVVKVGAGEALLGSVNLNANTPDFKVEQGILTLTDSRAGILAMLSANVAAGATFRVNLADARTLGSEITGTGKLDLQSDAGSPGVKLVAVASQPTVSTTNIGSDVRLDVSAVTAITGITADTGSFMDIGALGAGRTLSLTQGTDGVFNGVIEGTANFTVKGAGLFRYANSLQATTIGDVTVDGGFLGVNVDNTKAIALATATTGTSKLGVHVATGGNAIYNGTLTGAPGAAQMVKLGAGTLDLTSGVTSSLKDDVFASYDVREGTLATTLVADPLNPTGPGLILPNSLNVGRAVTLSGGTLALTVGAVGGTLLSGSGSASTGNLKIETQALGDASILNVLGNVSGNVSVDGGTVLNLGSAGASLLSITGDLAVTGGSKLTGSANIIGNLTVSAGSTLAPGYSPGTLNVTGNFTLAGTANMEVSGNSLGGLYNDSVNFTGTANLAAGTVLIQRWNDGATPAVAPAFGQRFVLFKGTATPSAGANLVATYFTGATPSSITTDDTLGRYLVVAPAAVDAGAVVSAYDGLTHNADGLAHKPNEYAVYAVRDESAYAVAGIDVGIIAYVQAATKVAPGTVYVPGAINSPGSVASLDPLAARLMTMSDAQLTPALLSLQPAALAAIPAAMALGQRAESGALLRRLEMRRYDRAGYSVYYNEGFALATSSSFKGGSGADATPFDSTVTGAMGGLLKDLNPWSVAGFSAGYTKSKANLSAGGVSAGSVSGNAYRLTGFFSSMLGERKDSLFVDAGISVGTSTNKSSRTTFLGTETASPKATGYGAFARLGAGYATKAGVSFSPYVGVDFAKVSGSGFDEAGDASALKVSSYSYTSARATVGSGMTWLTVGDGETLKFSIDFEAFAELGGGKSTDITARIGNIDFTSEANVSAGSGFRIAPSFTYGPNPDSAYYLTLSLEKAGATQTTGFELGYRRRF